MLLAGVLKTTKGRVGLAITVIVALVALLAPVLAPYDPYDVYQQVERDLPPGPGHWLGTDQRGIDLLSAVIYGARVSLTVGLTTSLLICALGALIGVAAGYLGGTFDTLVMRLADILFCIPSLPLMIILAAYLGTSFWNIILIFVVLGWAGLARLVRSQVLSLRERPFVEAAIVAGAKPWRVMLYHILPGVSSLVIINGVLAAAGLMLAEAGLSFLGFGDPRAISWGKILAQAQGGSAGALGLWWWVVFPGAALSITALGFMLVGLAMEEGANPNLRRKV
jgi:peptide/nickel transport system permease protein